MSVETLPTQITDQAEETLERLSDECVPPSVVESGMIPRSELRGIWIDRSVSQVSKRALGQLANATSVISYCNADRAANGGRPLLISQMPPA